MGRERVVPHRLDVRTGRTAFSVRTGLGTLMNNHYSAVTLAPDGSAYVATLGGMVRVQDCGLERRPHLVLGQPVVGEVVGVLGPATALA